MKENYCFLCQAKFNTLPQVEQHLHTEHGVKLNVLFGQEPNPPPPPTEQAEAYP